jgi:2-oxoisovalerate dehydrogenase E1 component
MAIFRDIPGVLVACPSNGEDAAKMLRTCVRLAHEQRRVVIFLEPIALYMTRDLHAAGDGQWLFEYPAPGAADSSAEIPYGQFGVYGDGTDLCIVSYANGYYLSRQAEKILAEKHGIKSKLIDLRWMTSIDHAALARETAGCKTVLVVDECRESGSLSEELVTALVEHGQGGKPIKRLCARDCFIPLGEASNSTLPSRDGIVDAALALTGRGGKSS